MLRRNLFIPIQDLSIDLSETLPDLKMWHEAHLQQSQCLSAEKKFLYAQFPNQSPKQLDC